MNPVLSSRTLRIALRAGALVGALLGGAGYGWRLLAERALYDDTTELAALRAQLEQAKAVEPPPAPVPTPLMLEALPDVTGALRELESLGGSTKAGLANVQAQSATTPGRQSFKLAGIGSAQALCGLLAAIEGSQRLMVIESCAVRAGKDEQVEYEIGLATFHRLGGKR